MAAAQGEASYTAVFDEAAREYAITWLDDEGAEIDVTRAAYGTVPSHADATKPSSADYDYTFVQWAPEVAAVTGEAAYTAVFRVTAHEPDGDAKVCTDDIKVTAISVGTDGGVTIAFVPVIADAAVDGASAWLAAAAGQTTVRLAVTLGGLDDADATARRLDEATLGATADDEKGTVSFTVPPETLKAAADSAALPAQMFFRLDVD